MNSIHHRHWLLKSVLLASWTVAPLLSLSLAPEHQTAMFALNAKRRVPLKYPEWLEFYTSPLPFVSFSNM